MISQPWGGCVNIAFLVGRVVFRLGEDLISISFYSIIFRTFMLVFCPARTATCGLLTFLHGG